MDDSKIIKIPLTPQPGITLNDPEVSTRIIHTPKPKGAPIPGVNYGVDLVTDKIGAPGTPPVAPPPPREKNKGPKQFMPYGDDDSGSQGSFRGSPRGSPQGSP